MNRKKLVVVVLLFVAGGCRQSTTGKPEQPEPATPETTDYRMAVVNGNNEFATDLYARLSADQPGNLFFSPYSISSALAMTYAGANGETAAQMAKVLHFPAPEAKLHPAFNALRKKMAASGKDGFQLRVANRLWGQNGFQFLPAFLGVTRADYGAELGLLDFNQTEAARKMINAWIEEQTDDKIQDLLAPDVLSPRTRLVLTNAIYFKARWTHEFSEAATTDEPFHLSDSEQITVPTMHQRGGFGYGESGDVQILALPYGQVDSLSMLILLPRKIDGLADLEKRLTSENLELWAQWQWKPLVNVHLPKFKMTSEFSLGDVLASLGMPLAFSDDADFSRMSTQERLFLSAVIHKALVDVNEEGTEAAAATAIPMDKAAIPPAEEPIEFRANHPLVFVIRDHRTQSILFLGRLVNPKD